MRGAEHRVGQVVRPHVFVAEAQPLADHQRTDQRRNARADMHDRAAGEVERAAQQRRHARGRHVRQHAAVPHPVAQRAVNQRAPQNREHHHRAELHPLGKCAADQRRA